MLQLKHKSFDLGKNHKSLSHFKGDKNKNEASAFYSSSPIRLRHLQWLLSELWLLRLPVAIRKGSAITRLIIKEHLSTFHYHLLDNMTLFPQIRNGLMVSMLDCRSQGRGIESPLSISLFHS